MNRLLSTVALLLFACASASPPPKVRAPAPATASFVIPKPTHWELPVRVLRDLLVRVDGAVLALAAEAPGGGREPDEQTLRVVTIDPATLEVVQRREPFAHGQVFADWTLAEDALYVLLDEPDDERHLLLAVDPMTLSERGRSERKGSIHAVVDQAFPPRVELGPRGVHVLYRTFSDKTGDRITDEAHARDDVRILMTRKEAVPWVEPSRAPWTFDPEHGRITSGDGRAVECPTHGTLLGHPVWSGRRMFVATEGCCGGPSGGFFVCEVPEASGDGREPNSLGAWGRSPHH